MVEIYQDTPSETTTDAVKLRRRRKHVPHDKQPVHRVRRRNARERCRVDQVNEQFAKIRELLPDRNRRKRISKENILKYAIIYIRELNNLIYEHDISMVSGHNLHDVSKPMCERLNLQSDDSTLCQATEPCSDEKYVGCLRDLSVNVTMLCCAGSRTDGSQHGVSTILTQ
jgi:hypothetical protein